MALLIDSFSTLTIILLFICCSINFVFSGRIYVGVNEKKAWDEANTYCESVYGASLATITSSAENSAVRNAATKAGIGTSQLLWIGFNDINEEGSWEWVDGITPSDYTNWANGAPDQGSDHNVGYMTSSDTWQDGAISSQLYFVCMTSLCDRDRPSLSSSSSFSQQLNIKNDKHIIGGDSSSSSNNNINIMESLTTTSYLFILTQIVFGIIIYEIIRNMLCSCRKNIGNNNKEFEYDDIESSPLNEKKRFVAI